MQRPQQKNIEDDSSSDDDKQVFIEVTDPIELKKLSKEQKKAQTQNTIQPIIQDDRQKIQPVIVSHQKTENRDKKSIEEKQKKDKHKKEQKYTEKKGDQHQQQKKLQYKEKEQPSDKSKENQKKPLKFKQKASNNIIHIENNVEVQTLIEELDDKLKQNKVIKVKGIKGVAIQKAFLAVEQLHKIHPSLKRTNIPGTIFEDGRTWATIIIELTLKSGELNERHMGFQESIKKREPKKYKVKQENSDDERDYR